MKNVIALFLLLISLSLFSQNKNQAVIIHYKSALIFDEEKSSLIIPDGVMLPREMRQEMISNIEKPNFYNLLIYKNESLYEYKEIINNEQSSSLNARVKGPGSELKIYKNTNTFLYLAQCEFFGQLFLINDTIKQRKWILIDEEKEILDYNVKKAIIKENNQIITAWYCPELHYSTGPEYLTGLPGTILEVTYKYENDLFKDVTNQIVAQEIQIIDNKIKVAKPNSGKKVKNRSEYERIINEKIREFEDMRKEGVDKD